MRRLVPLLIVLVVIAGLRIYLIAHTEVIARDGTIYIQMAKQFPSAPAEVIANYDYHIGYPVAIAGFRRLILAAGFSDGLRVWEVSGQVVSLLASLGAMAAIWLFAGKVFGDWRIAWISTLIFGMGRKWAVLGSDVLSDSLAICLQMWAVVLAIYALEKLKANSRWSLVLAGGVGLCSGLGYLVRPESLLAVGLACLLWLAFQIRRPKSWRLTLSAVGVSIISTLACSLPYMIAIGGLTNKKTLSDLVTLPLNQGLNLIATIICSIEYSAIRQLVNKLFEALHPAAGVLVCIWLVCCVIYQLTKLKSLRAALPSLSPAGALLIVASIAVMGPLLMGLYSNVHYLSYRHVMFMAAALSPLIGAGVIVSARICEDLIARPLRLPLSQTVIVLIWVGAFAVSMSIHSLGPLHKGKLVYRHAGDYVGGLLSPDDFVLAENRWILHYAQAKGSPLPANLAGGDLAEYIKQSGATYLVLSDKMQRKKELDLNWPLPGLGLVELAKIDDHRSKRPRSVRVFSITKP